MLGEVEGAGGIEAEPSAGQGEIASRSSSLLAVRSHSVRRS